MEHLGPQGPELLSDFGHWPWALGGRVSRRLDLEVANLKEATTIIVRYHYLHRARTMAQLPYWIKLDNYRIGVILFALPRLSVPFCGYSPMELLELARLWMAPKYQGHFVVDRRGKTHRLCLASCAVARALKRCQRDWHSKYPRLPQVRAVVSWADMEHHEGTIYRAANFTEVGLSGGRLHGHAQRRNGGHDKLHSDYLHKKRAFVYPFDNPRLGP